MVTSYFPLRPSNLLLSTPLCRLASTKEEDIHAYEVTLAYEVVLASFLLAGAELNVTAQKIKCGLQAAEEEGIKQDTFPPTSPSCNATAGSRREQQVAVRKVKNIKILLN